MHRFFVSVLMCALVAPVTAEPKLEGAPTELMQYLINDKRVMTLGAESDVRVQADKAVVTLRVKNTDGNFGTALQANRALRDKLKQRLVGANIPTDNIKFAKYASVPSYGLFGDKPSNYEISNDVTIAVRGEDEIIAVAQAVDAFKEISYVSTEFQDTQKKANEAQALEAALQELRSRQALYEKTLGVALTILRIVDTPVALAAPTVQRLAGPPSKSSDAASSLLQSTSYTRTAETDSDRTSGFGALIYRATVRAEYLVK